MNGAAQTFAYDTSAGSSTSGAALLLILQILPQLEVLKRCRDGWKSVADTAKEEVEILRLRIARDQSKFRQIENEYYLKIYKLGLRMQKAIDEKQNVRNILLDTAVKLQKLQNHSKLIAANFSIEKQHFMNLINENNKYILTNKEFLKNISTELKSIIPNNATEKYNTTLKNEHNFEQEIRYSLEVLAKFIQNIKKELLEKSSKIAKATKSFDELMKEKQSCLSSKEELQEELNDANEINEELQKVKEEKQNLKHINENLLSKILTIVEGTAVNHNITLEIILKQTMSAATGIQKYIVEPAEDARNTTLNSILKNRTKEEALISASKKGNITEMSLLLDYGADIEGRDSGEWKLKPLHWASDQGHWKAVRLLLLRGADVNAPTHIHNVTALHIAVIKDHHNVMDLLLKGGADIEARDKYGFTPLFRAIMGDCQTVKFLVARGANVSTTNNKGESAVSMAPPDCVRELLCSKGANDPICRTEDETTASSPLECS